MTTFADRLADARASYAAGLAGATDAVVASSLALGHWHRMLARPPREDGRTAIACPMPKSERQATVQRDKTRPSVTTLPGFVESLRLLVEREKYSLLDIGLMFGITREYVRQLCGRNGIATPPRGNVSGVSARVVREWDDERHCFRPVPIAGHGVMTRVLIAEERRDVRSLVREGYRSHMVAAVASLRDRPFVTYAEAWRAISGRTIPDNNAINGMRSAWRVCCADHAISLRQMRETLARETGVTWAKPGGDTRSRNRGTFPVEHS